VGINYTGQQNSLQGCVDDAQNIYQFLLGLSGIYLMLCTFDVIEEQNIIIPIPTLSYSLMTTLTRVRNPREKIF
jgi:hypothetical protein